MVRVRYNKERKRLSPLGYKVSSLFRNACKIIEADDTTENIVYMLTNTIAHLNKLLLTYLDKPSKRDMN